MQMTVTFVDSFKIVLLKLIIRMYHEEWTNAHLPQRNNINKNSHLYI